MTVPDLMPLAEFRDLGWLADMNRRAFHPVGLALWVDVEAGTMGVYVDPDPDGWVFEESTLAEVAPRLGMCDGIRHGFAVRRLEKFGWVVQPIPLS